MKIKQLVRFYFSADYLNEELDGIILSYACKSANYLKSGEYYFQRIAAVIEAKCKLNALWGYLDNVMSGITARERAVLKYYGDLRHGIAKLDEGRKKEIKRVAVKFTRRARGVGRYSDGINMVKKYYCMMRAG